MGITVSLNCPACGGTLDVDDGSRAIACPYCTTLLWLEGDAGIRNVMFRNRVDRGRVLRITQGWFDEGLKARDLDRVGQVTEAYPIYVPFWKLNARAAGWVCGYEERTYTDSEGNTRTERVYHERMVFRDYTWTNIACDAGDIGVHHLRNTQGEVVSQDTEVPTFEVTTSRGDANDQGAGVIRQQAIDSARIPRVTFAKMQVLPRSMVLIFYPVWVVRYDYRGRAYFNTVDGVTGQVLSGRAPGDPLYQSLIMTGGTSAAGLLAGLGTFAALVFTESPEFAIAPIVAGAVILYATYRFFRHGSEIVEGDIEAAYGIKKDLKKFQRLMRRW